MLGALWFLIKLSALVALAVWASNIPGTVRLEWLDYTVTTEIGYFLMTAAVVILVAIFIYNTIRTIVDFPASYRRYREIRERELGYRALTIGLTAVAAGDTKVAAHQAARCSKFLKKDNGLPLLLRAQASRMQGMEEEALQSFAALVENKDAAFLGVRGLLQAALDHKNYAKALDFARQALKLHPRQPWILKLVYDLEIRQRHWNDALATLDKGVRLKAFTKEQAASDRAAIFLTNAEIQGTPDHEVLNLLKATLRIAPGFTPASIALAAFYNRQNQRRRAVMVIERAWKNNPHPELATFWATLVPVKKSKDPMARMKWFEKLYRVNSTSTASHIEAARAAMRESLWGEARTYLNEAIETDANALVYELFADLERMSGQSEHAAQNWLSKAQTAKPAPAWICRETGLVYKNWSAIAEPHGSFNTIEWRAPEALAHPVRAEHIPASAVIDAPR